MYLLYLDESGSPDSHNFVVAGIAVHETSVQWATNALDTLQRQYFPGMLGSVQFHAAPLRGNPQHRVEEPFDQLDPATRHQLLDSLYEVAQHIYGRFFAVVVEKAYLYQGEDPYERALEEILSRFDLYLNRLYRESGNRNKGIVVVADSSYRERLETVARQFVTEGTRWRALRDVLDIPVFTLAKHNRLLQIADLIANTVYGRYEHGHARQFDNLMPQFDRDDRGRIHGLVHITGNRAQCFRPCCQVPPDRY